MCLCFPKLYHVPFLVLSFPVQLVQKMMFRSRTVTWSQSLLSLRISSSAGCYTVCIWPDICIYIYIYAMCVHIFSYGQLSYPIYLFIYFICIHAHICIHNIYTSILSLPFRTTFIIVWGWQRLRNRKQKSKAMESFWTPLAVAKDDLTFLGAAGGKCSDEGWLMRVYLI